MGVEVAVGPKRQRDAADAAHPSSALSPSTRKAGGASGRDAGGGGPSGSDGSIKHTIVWHMPIAPLALLLDAVPGVASHKAPITSGPYNPSDVSSECVRACVSVVMEFDFALVVVSDRSRALKNCNDDALLDWGCCLACD